MCSGGHTIMESTGLMTYHIAQKLLVFGGLWTLEDLGAETYIQASQIGAQRKSRVSVSPNPRPGVSHFYPTDS